MNPPTTDLPSTDVRAAIFDLDGTLIDSLADIAAAANRVLTDRGFPEHSRDAFRTLVGDGVRVLFERALPAGEQQDESLLTACIDDFKVRYAQSWDQTTRPYEGIDDMLQSLAGRDLALAVLSNKPHDFTVGCVERFFPEISWAAIRGHQPDVPRKPDPAGVRQILSPLKIPAHECLYIGDTNTDMETATRAGCYAVGVTWGFRSAEELQRSGADRLVDHPRELAALVDSEPG